MGGHVRMDACRSLAIANLAFFLLKDDVDLLGCYCRLIARTSIVK